MRLKELPHGLQSDRGKVLRLKEGYNPNSSSLGSVVFSFPEAFLAAPAIAGVVTGTIAAWIMKRDKNKSDLQAEESDNA